MDPRFQQPSWVVPFSGTSHQHPFDTAMRSRSNSSGSDASTAQSEAARPVPQKVATSARPTTNGVAGPSRAGPSNSVGPSAKPVGIQPAAQKSKAQAAPGAQAQTQAKAKRKRDGDGKRRKVAKACLVCQKSHLTCDENRPCTRCVTKGIADQCVEGVRKKAKYLMEGDFEEALDPQRDRVQPTISVSPSALSAHRPPDQTEFAPPPPTQTQPAAAPVMPSMIQRTSSSSQVAIGLPSMASMTPEDDIWLAPPPDPGGFIGSGDAGLGGGDGLPGLEGGEGLWGDTNLFGNGGFDFGTSASNEYQMLDAMLNSMSPPFPFDMGNDTSLNLDPLPPPQQPLHSPFYSDPGLAMLSGPSHLPQPHQPDFSRNHLGGSPQPLISPNWPVTQPRVSDSHRLSTSSVQGSGPAPWSGWIDNTDSRGSIGGISASASDQGRNGNGSGSGLSGDRAKLETQEQALGGGTAGPRGGRMKTGAEVYHSVVQPFDYTEGYHRLMEHISKNFQQKEVFRVVKALAAFRPSLIALQMPMSEEDEVFLERSFQRTLIELEKLISYSATPTAVWRRTGEMVYANPEFCGLIGKQQDELLSGRTYVYQLFAKQSAILYWENFSVHAFENTTQNFFQATTLDVGDTQLACSCCYTIRRDVFDLPSVIIGQFLPIPTE